jgi:hypothetical protein
MAPLARQTLPSHTIHNPSIVFPSTARLVIIQNGALGMRIEEWIATAQHSASRETTTSGGGDTR